MSTSRKSSVENPTTAVSIDRRSMLAGALAFSAFGAPNSALAQEDYPARSIQIVCPLPPGTGGDILVRFLAERLRRLTNQQMVVLNRLGADGGISAEHTIRSKPDGYTMLFHVGSALAANSFLNDLQYNFAKDLTPVTTLVRVPFFVVVPTESPHKTLADLVASLRSKGDKGLFAVSNNLAEMSGLLLNAHFDLAATPVQYKTTMDAFADMNRNLVDYSWAEAPFAIARANENKLRILGVSTAERASFAPAVPTIQEIAGKDFNLSAWWGAWFPADTPPEVVSKMQGLLNRVMEDPEVKQFFSKMPADLFPGTSASARKFIEDDLPRWRAVVALLKARKK